MRPVRIGVLALAVVLAVSALAVSGCSRATGASLTKLTVTGSTTILPIAEVAAEDFMAANPGTRVLVAGVGSSAGIESVTNGTSDIGTSSRDLKPEELSLGLVDTKIARDAIAVIVNHDNPVTSLTTSQVADVFAGKITNWKQLGGPDLVIGLVNRDEASGTREAFSKIVLKGGDFDPTAAVLPGTGQVRSVVAQSRSAIGYISLGFVDASVKALVIDGVTPDEKTVADGTYPISRLLHFFTKGAPKGLAKSYIDFVLSAAVQEKVVRDAGFLPIAEGGK
jgi:phosphate transport system substrate-binding protein